MVDLKSITDFCDQRTQKDTTPDFDQAFNGLQLENNGIVSKIGAAVDAGQIPFELAIQEKVDFLICHHGLFWNPIAPLTGHNYKKIQTAIKGNIAVYSSHLPLDSHEEIGNNALLSEALELKPIKQFLDYKGTQIGLISEGPQGGRSELQTKLKALFPKTYGEILYGDSKPKKIAILTGSGQSAVAELLQNGVDTLITGELRQHHFNMAQELKLNLFPCGHYATETFGVQRLAKEVAETFKIEWTFLKQDCLL